MHITQALVGVIDMKRTHYSSVMLKRLQEGSHTLPVYRRLQHNHDTRPFYSCLQYEHHTRTVYRHSGDNRPLPLHVEFTGERLNIHEPSWVKVFKKKITNG